MRLRCFCLPSCMIIAVAGLESEDLAIIPPGDAAHDAILFNNDNMFDKPAEAPSNFFLDDSVPDSSFDNDGGWPADVLLADSDDPNQMAEPNLDFLLAGPGDCVIGGTENGQLFGKVRRGESCRAPPVGQAQNPDQPKDPNSPKDDASSFNPYAAVLAQGLQRNFELCPLNIFGLSNIPVCKPLDEVEDFQLIGPNLYNIDFVLPRTYLHHRF